MARPTTSSLQGSHNCFYECLQKQGIPSTRSWRCYAWVSGTLECYEWLLFNFRTEYVLMMSCLVTFWCSLVSRCRFQKSVGTQTMEWFVERGFEEVTVDKLPPSRRAMYNYKRASKIYMKKIESSRDLDASELWWNR